MLCALRACLCVFAHLAFGVRVWLKTRTRRLDAADSRLAVSSWLALMRKEDAKRFLPALRQEYRRVPFPTELKNSRGELDKAVAISSNSPILCADRHLQYANRAALHWTGPASRLFETSS
jgi:hypothetical protein